MKRCGPPMGDRRTKRRVARPEREREAVEDQRLERNPEQKEWWGAEVGHDPGQGDYYSRPRCRRCGEIVE